MKKWNDWRWQKENTLRYTEENNSYEVKIPPYYQKLMDSNNENCPIKKQCIPDNREKEEYVQTKYEIDIKDPLEEVKYSPTRNLVHKYPEKILLLVTNQCFMNCRFCTRRRITACNQFEFDFEETLSYIRQHNEIRDVLISGGDPLTLEDEMIEFVIKKLKKINHIDVIRIGTRAPVVMPMRITNSLVNMLKNYQPIWINTHFNSYKEITPESKEACRKIVDAGIPLGNQSVLLKGINDNTVEYKKLCMELIKMRVRPYYLYQCDVGKGLQHFRTRIDVGMQIIEEMKKTVTGFAIPEYIIDLPNGGKMRVQNNNIVKMDEKKVVIKDYNGNEHIYPQGE